MIKIENTEEWGFEHAIRGMRNPLNSWERIDSEYFACSCRCGNCDLAHKCVPDSRTKRGFVVGDNDYGLMKRLANAGATHRKYLRQIFVSVDITAPLYWWKEFDTYKVGTTSNSCSTMHKIQAKEFEFDDFSHDRLLNSASEEINKSFIKWSPVQAISMIIEELNWCRKMYLETKDKVWWWQMIQLLPSSYNQKRTITMTYENLVNILETRSNHKLDEWRYFCNWIETLPLGSLLREGATHESSAKKESR